MVIRLIQDIRKALENELYFVALSSALTLPDICGKAAYPQEQSSKKRYILWYDEEIGKYETQKQEAEETKESLVAMKDNVNSPEYIEEIAREKLGMYLPNERVYIDIGK